MIRNSNNEIWKHFERNQETKRAECNYCGSFLSFKSTVTNLKQHLRLKHLSVYNQLPASTSGSERVSLKNEEAKEDSDAGELVTDSEMGEETEYEVLTEEIFDSDFPMEYKSYDPLKEVKRRPSNRVLYKTKPAIRLTAPTPTSPIDKLNAARLEMLKLRIVIAKKEHQMNVREHELKMQHLQNEEKRKKELHEIKTAQEKAGLRVINMAENS